MQNLCFKRSFNIQFYGDDICSKETGIEGFRDLYTYEWDNCYKRTATQWMKILEPVWDVKTNEVGPGPVSAAVKSIATASAVSILAFAATF